MPIVTRIYLKKNQLHFYVEGLSIIHQIYNRHPDQNIYEIIWVGVNKRCNTDSTQNVPIFTKTDNFLEN